MQQTPLRLFYHSFLDSTGSSLAASSTSSTSDHSLSYVTNWLEVNSWKESTGASTARTITYDAGAGNAYAADYALIYGHNFTTDSTIQLVNSTSSDFAAPTAVASIANPTTAPILLEFTRTTSFRWWRFNYSGSTATQIAIQILALGTMTELGYITPPFDPYGQEIMANVNVAHSGAVAGIHERYTERQVQVSLFNQTTDVYASVRTWIDSHGPKNLLVAWNSTGSTADRWLMRPDLQSSNPITVDKYRNITIGFRGRKA